MAPTDSPPWSAPPRRVASAAVALAAALLASSEAAAQGAPPAAPPRRDSPGEVVAWDPAWPKFRTAEYVATGLMLAGAFGSLAIPVSETRWTKVDDLDATLRDTFRAGGVTERAAARDASDLLLTLMINQLTIDTLIVTWWGHGRGSVAWQMIAMDAEALAFTTFVNGMVAGLASRERPYRDDCVGPEETQSRDCRESKRYRSFFSGHTSTAFTIAGLTCQHHAHLPLYGGGAPEALTCATSFLAAATVGSMRVVSDQHFATDVLVGAALGTFSGLGLPYFLHYGAGSRAAPEPGGVSIGVAPAPFGGYLTGAF